MQIMPFIYIYIQIYVILFGVFCSDGGYSHQNQTLLETEPVLDTGTGFTCAWVASSLGGPL
jgi:hypothetical protein